ncbi:MAG: hypothetical protein IJY20_08895 [Clostridia bacterium]|nr:hypothetical protein [Clostridia bacterium]
MKKLISLFLAVLLCVTALSSCSLFAYTFDYENEDLTPYVTLPNLAAGRLQVTLDAPPEPITEEWVDNYIDEILVERNAYYRPIDEPGIVCEMGDTLGITYKGVLVETLTLAGFTEKGTNKDGTPLTAEQIKNLKGFSGGEATSTQYLQLGSGSYIDGFEEGLVGKCVGDARIPLELTFPNDYSNRDMAGRQVVFFVSIHNKLQTVKERALAFGDAVYLTYSATLDDKDKAYEFLAEASGQLEKEEVTALVNLSKDDQFHAALIREFSKRPDDNRFGSQFTFSDDKNLVIRSDVDGEQINQDVTVTVHYTVTVHKLCTVRYCTHKDAERGEPELSTLKRYFGYTSPDAEFASYADFKAALTDKLTREQQIEQIEERRRTAFEALLEASTLDLSSEEMTRLLEEYVNQLSQYTGYVDMFALTSNDQFLIYDGTLNGFTSISGSDGKLVYSQMIPGTEIGDSIRVEYGSLPQGSGTISTIVPGNGIQFGEPTTPGLSQPAVYYGQVTRESFMFNFYLDCYNSGTKNIRHVAQEYASERLVFYQYAKEYGIAALTEAEYEAGYEAYRALYTPGKDLFEEMGITEEQFRELLYWDKVIDHLIENHCEITHAPEETEE